VELYVHALRLRLLGQVLEQVRIASRFVLRSVDPPIQEVTGKRVLGLRRLGKRIVFELEEELCIGCIS
jgi:formamidopyrimidine-DNA glycosylase